MNHWIKKKEYNLFRASLRAAFKKDKPAQIVCRECGFRLSCSNLCLTHENFVEHAYQWYVAPCAKCGKLEKKIETKKFLKEAGL